VDRCLLRPLILFPQLHSPEKLIRSSLITLFFLAAIASSVSATEKILFFGNSYTFGALAPAALKLGGVPKLVEGIAASKGKKAEVSMVVAGGKDLGYLLHLPTTESALTSKQWDCVVLQDFSTQTTHLGNLAESLANGEVFYRKIRSHSPQAGIVLYETWARGKGHSYYTGVSSKNSFVGPDQMLSELEHGYHELDAHLEALEPGDQSSLAPVGEAFALCQRKFPAIDLYSVDHHHANEQGYYLSALVLYATIFHDSPLGATREFPGLTLDPTVAAKLQQIASEVIVSRGTLQHHS